MAISKMTKILIVSHRSESDRMLETLQDEGLVHLLDAERAMVSKEWPELHSEGVRPRDLEDMVARLDKAIDFLDAHAREKSGGGMFAPRIAVDKGRFTEVTTGRASLELLEKTEEARRTIEQLTGERENLGQKLQTLRPWQNLDMPVEDLYTLSETACIAGLIPTQNLQDVIEDLGEKEAAMQTVSETDTHTACLIVCLNDAAPEIHKILRNNEFEAAAFESMKGVPSDEMRKIQSRIDAVGTEIENTRETAAQLAADRIRLKILEDHYRNLLSRAQVRNQAPETEQVILLEGWVRQADLARLEKVIDTFSATTLGVMDIQEGEDIPVEIENNPAVRPFEVVTRLYGMPVYSNIDPTMFLAPFFALFFGICLTDAGYGLVLIGLLWWMLKKIQGDKKAFIMLFICSVITIVAGALTGGWFGDALQSLIPKDTAAYTAINSAREKVMLFDPMKDPMIFFGISLGLGYIQVLFGLFVAFFHNLSRKNYAAALCDQMSWIFFLNCLLLFGVSKAGFLPAPIAGIAGIVSILLALVILLFSERSGPWGGRIGMGVFQLFSTVFYVGDVLSYVRLMALGMVTGGFGMAINVLVKLVMDIPVPFLGYLLGALLFVGGHLFNLGMSVLSAFVHSLRLQFVEFFPKFMVGGGHTFDPIRKKYNHIYIEDK